MAWSYWSVQRKRLLCFYRHEKFIFLNLKIATDLLSFIFFTNVFDVQFSMQQMAYISEKNPRLLVFDGISSMTQGFQAMVIEWFSARYAMRYGPWVDKLRCSQKVLNFFASILFKILLTLENFQNLIWNCRIQALIRTGDISFDVWMTR